MNGYKIHDKHLIHVDERGMVNSFEGIAYNNIFISTSNKNVFRGFHGQFGQHKVVTLLSGHIIDYKFNPSTEIVTSIELHEDGLKSVIFEPGLLHAFFAVKKSTVMYQLSEPQDLSKSFGFNYKGLITLPVNDPIMSERDRNLPLWKKTDHA